MGAPSLIDHQSDTILDLLNGVAAWLYNHVEGGVITDGGTTQSSGAGVAPNVDVDTTIIVDAFVQGQPTELAAQTDGDSDAGDQVAWGATSGVEAYAAVCLSTGVAGGTPALEVVFGAVATTAAGAAKPTDDEIDTFLTHENWARVGTFLLTRTGDTSITFTEIDHTDRAATFRHAGDLSVTESDFASGGVTRVQPIVTDPPPSVSTP